VGSSINFDIGNSILGHLALLGHMVEVRLVGITTVVCISDARILLLRSAESIMELWQLSPSKDLGEMPHSFKIEKNSSSKVLSMLLKISDFSVQSIFLGEMSHGFRIDKNSSSKVLSVFA
jgi:hypothetical protein